MAAEPLHIPLTSTTTTTRTTATTVRSRLGTHRHKHHIRAAFRSASLVLLVAGYCAYNYVSPGTVSTGGRLDARGLSTSRAGRSVGGEGDNGGGISDAEPPGGRRRRLSHVEDDRTERPGDSFGFRENVIHRSDFYTVARLEEQISQEEQISSSRSSSSSQAGSHERMMEEDSNLKSCDDMEKADPVWLIPFYLLGILYMFLALAIVCDEFFVPALEEISCEHHLNLSMDVAGATLMAAGGSAPELFTSLFGTFTESEVGFGTIVGSAVFNVLFVIAMCALLSKDVLSLTWWPLFRDSTYYAIGLVVLAIFTGVVSDGLIELWEAIVLFCMYLGYVVLMYFNRAIYKKLTGKELDLEGSVSDAESQDGAGGEEAERAPHHRPSAYGPDGAEIPVNFRWPATFRAGVLKLLRDPDSWLETAGVGIVSKIAGDVEDVFKETDLNSDGEVSKEELAHLFTRLDCHLTPEELNRVFDELDTDHDGKISEKEFTAWYIRSEERILSRARHTFDQFDADNSGAIDRDEVKRLLEKLEPRVTDADVDEALSAMYKEGSRDEITYEEFADWYIHSMIFDRQKKEIEEEVSGACESLKPPRGEGFLAWMKYLILLPLVGTLTATVPDVRRPGLGKWCYVSFVVSILWIGFYSYFMVGWAETVGNTIGIPSVVMGLTLLAAGTSVPDLLSSVIVARRGEGDMAVSSSIGSNIFDILVGLPVPWIIYTAWPDKPDTVIIGSDGVWVSIFVLLGMLIFIIIAIHCQGWKLTKALAGMMFVFYFAFLAQAIILEIPFETCIE